MLQDGELIDIIKGNLPNNSSTYPWNIDNSYSAGNNYKIRITSDDDGDIYDQTGVFSIVNP